MPQFQFKIKGYLNEPGEYSEKHTTESGTILHFIIQHWFNETLPNNLDIVYIEDEHGDRLVIDHVKRDIFEYYFIPKGTRSSYYHKMTDIQLMFFLLESFFSGRKSDLRHNLTVKSDDHNFILGDFIGKDFTYRVTNKRIYSHLSQSAIPLFMFFILVIAGTFSSKVYLITSVPLLLITILTGWRKFRFVKVYYDDNSSMAVRMSRADQFIHVTRGSASRDIPKSDIARIVKFISPPDDVRTVADYHTEIVFHNGNVLTLSDLLIPQQQIESKFANDLIPLEFKILRSIKDVRKTDLSKYLSAVSPGRR